MRVAAYIFVFDFLRKGIVGSFQSKRFINGTVYYKICSVCVFSELTVHKDAGSRGVHRVEYSHRRISNKRWKRSNTIFTNKRTNKNTNIESNRNKCETHKENEKWSQCDKFIYICIMSNAEHLTHDTSLNIRILLSVWLPYVCVGAQWWCGVLCMRMSTLIHTLCVIVWIKWMQIQREYTLTHTHTHTHRNVTHRARVSAQASPFVNRYGNHHWFYQ